MNTVFQYLSYHLLSSISLAFILGIATTSFAQHLNVYPSVAVSTLVLIFSLSLTCHLFKKQKCVFILFIFLFFGIGFLHAQLKSVPPDSKDHIWNRIHDKQEVVVIGTLASMVQFNGKTCKIILSTKFLRFPDWKDLRPASGNILLQMEGPWPDQFSPGDKLALRAELKRPSSFASPGSFDYGQYLARKDIWITGFIRSPLFIKKISESSTFFHKLRFYPEKIRMTVGREIDKRVSSKTGGLYRAILIGDRSGVSETVLEQFKASGVMHILAISGIHMSVIGALLFGLFYRILSLSETLLLKYNVKKTAALFCLPVLILYSLIAGLNTPVVRSVIMSTIVIAGICIDRKKTAAELLFFAAFLILTFSPLQLFTASFQLSFTAVAAIFFILPILKKLLTDPSEDGSVQTTPRKITNWLLAGLLVSTAATLATAPLSLYYFNRISLVGPLTNLFLEPLICFWGLPAGIISIPFLFFVPEIGGLCLNIGGFGLDIALNIASFFSTFSYSDIRLPTPSLWIIFCYYICLICLALLAARKKYYSLGGIFILFTCVITLMFNPETFRGSMTNNSFTLVFLDVGQGSSTLIEYPSGYRVLVDGGGSSYLKKATIGERVIGPYLWKKGISHIDDIIVTHPDADHYNGLSFIADNFSPSGIWLNTTSGGDSFFKQFLNHIKKSEISTHLVTDGLQLRGYPELLQCIANSSRWTDDGAPQGKGKRRNTGLIVQACANNHCLLLPGDIGKRDERALVEKKLPLYSNFLLSPHHGSATSNSEEFLQAVQPDYMIVSAGKNRTATFPHPGLRTICDLNNIKLLQTAQSGTIEIEVTPQTYKIFGYRKIGNNPLINLSRFYMGEHRLPTLSLNTNPGKREKQ